VLGGIASASVVNNGGLLNVFSGGFSRDAIINGGGFEQLGASGVASNTTVNSGGTLEVDSGGVVSGVAVMSGGEIDVSGLVSGLALGGGTAVLNASLDQNVQLLVGTTGKLTVMQAFTGVISGWSAGDQVDLSFLTYNASYSRQWTSNGSGGSLAIMNGATQVATLNLSGDYGASSFVLTDDGTGKTLVTGASPDLTTVTYSGSAASYSVIINPDGGVSISDLRPGSPDGTHSYSAALQTITFADATDGIVGNVLTQYNNHGSAIVSTFNIDPGAGYTSTVYSYANNMLVSARFNGVTGQSYSSYEYDYVNNVYTGAKYYTTGVTGQIYTGSTTATNTAGDVLSQTFTGVTGQPFSSYEYDFSHGHFIGQKLFYTDVGAGAPYTAYEADYTGGGTLARLAFTAASGQPYSSYEYDYVNGMYAGLKFDYANVTGASYSAYEIDYDAYGFSGLKFFYTQVPGGASYSGYEVDYDKNGSPQRLLLTGVTGQTYNSYEYDYTNGSISGSRFFYDGSAAGGYSSYEQDYDAGGTATTTKYFFTNVDTPTYNAYEVDLLGGANQKFIFDNNDGSHTQQGFADGQTFTALGNDTFTGGMNNETFVFQNTYGNATISDFYLHLAGAGADTIQFSTNMFTDVNAMLLHTVDSANGAVITDGSGNTLTLSHVTTADISNNQTDFKFV
jgi:autotransporter passenger strand-loop-strand repeat protein